MRFVRGLSLLILQVYLDASRLISDIMFLATWNEMHLFISGLQTTSSPPGAVLDPMTWIAVGSPELLY